MFSTLFFIFNLSAAFFELHWGLGLSPLFQISSSGRKSQFPDNHYVYPVHLIFPLVPLALIHNSASFHSGLHLVLQKICYHKLYSALFFPQTLFHWNRTMRCLYNQITEVLHQGKLIIFSRAIHICARTYKSTH